MKILVVDDDRHIREVVRFALEQQGFQVHEAENGKQALKLFAELAPDLLVLDIIMPEEDGFAVCREIRRTSEVPILFLSSRDDEIDRVCGLELGADDYIVKPFSPRELVARVRANLRRTTKEKKPDDGIVTFGSLLLDPDRHRCTWQGHDVKLTATEFSLLLALTGAPGRVYSRDALVERAYEYGHHITGRTIDSHIRRLRKKLNQVAPDPIETVFGVGYRLREES